jgi:transmembrane sensor
MSTPENPMAEQDAIKREAHDWVMRLTSGEATAADAEALHRWRRTSRAHRQAFAEANLLWDKLRPAAAQANRGEAVATPVRDTRVRLGRRAFLGGAITAAAASIGYAAVVRPPLDLWPSLTEMTADYRTGVGQQQQIAFDDRVSIKLNTRTSITTLSSGDLQGDRIELVAGEAAIEQARSDAKPFVVVAAQGQTTAEQGRFNIRHDVSSVCVTCLEGELRVAHLGQTVAAGPRQQVVYTRDHVSAAVDIDPETVTAWERGLLVFRNDPLSRVIEEVNRYRPGKIILTRAELGRRPVLATFRIDRIDDVIPRLQSVFDVRVTALPGGIVLVG